MLPHVLVAGTGHMLTRLAERQWEHPAPAPFCTAPEYPPRCTCIHAHVRVWGIGMSLRSIDRSTDRPERAALRQQPRTHRPRPPARLWSPARRPEPELAPRGLPLLCGQ